MVKRTWRLNGSPNWTHLCWNIPGRKSCRFSTLAHSKTWRVCSRLGTRRRSSSWAGGRSMVTSQRLVEKRLSLELVSSWIPSNVLGLWLLHCLMYSFVVTMFVLLCSWKIWERLREWQKRDFHPLWRSAKSFSVIYYCSSSSSANLMSSVGQLVILPLDQVEISQQLLRYTGE